MKKRGRECVERFSVVKGLFSKNIRTVIESFIQFFISIIYCELLIKCMSWEEGSGSPAFLLFIPAEALFFVLFCNLFSNKIVNRILSVLIMLPIVVYYIAQLLSIRQLGSPFSVSLAQMGGEAVTDFWWTFEATLLGSIGWIILLLLPLIGSVIFLFSKLSKSDRVQLSARATLLLLTVVLWFGAIGGIRLAGKEKASAYYVLSNAYSDTETSSQKLGLLTTSIIEAGAYFLGINSNSDIEDFAPVVIETPEVALQEDILEDSFFLQEVITESSDEEQKPELHINDRIDFDYLSALSDEEDVKALCDYFASKPAASFNEYTGLFEDYNLIYICAESFTTYALNEKLTPLLCEMARGGVVLNNFYSSFKNTTTNGEFAYSVSLWPDVSRKAADGNAVGSFACSAQNYMPYGLGNIFNELNVPTYGFHGYVSSYYKRCDSWPNLGYRTMKFMNEGLTFKNKWSPADTELMEQTVDEFINDDRFFTYYMTYSGHGGYTTATYMYIKNNEKVRELLGEHEYSDEEISYFCGAYELELAMEYLVERLRDAGKLDKTVFVLAGDHIPYNFTNEVMEDLCKKANLPYDNIFEKYRSTCIIYNSGLKEPIVSDEYCCTVDVLPTVLNLFGIDYDSRLIAGSDVFDNTTHKARLYNGNLMTEFVNYNSSNGKSYWKEAALEWTEEEKEEYLSSLVSNADSEYAVSLKLMEKDFYRFVWDNLK